MDKKNIRASFTVEAAVIVPFILFLSISVLGMGIEFYQDSIWRPSNERHLEIDCVKRFYQLQMLEDLGKDVYDNGT